MTHSYTGSASREHFAVRSIFFLCAAVLLLCFESNALSQACTNLCLQQTTCPTPGVTTSVSGTVYAPNGVHPLPNVLVYIPNAPVDPFTPGVACMKLGEPASGSPLVSTTTAVDGTFTLTNVPVGDNIPLVIQAGRWRRQTVIATVAACTNTTVPASQTRFPRNRTEGDIPHIALVTGQVDAVECVLRKIGLDDGEFADPVLDPTGLKAIHLFVGQNTGGAHLGPGTPEIQLVSSLTTINKYDMVILACQGTPYDTNARNSASLMNLGAYANNGGRLFATHYSYVWMYNPLNYPQTNPAFSNVALWSPQQSFPANQNGYVNVNVTFPKGQTLADWLMLPAVGASTTRGVIPLTDIRKDQNGVLGKTQSWVTINSPPEVVQFTFNTPVNAAAENQCGRVLYTEHHIEYASTYGSVFPTECGTSPMDPQEKLLEFSLFDLTTFVSPDVPPALTVVVTHSPATFVLGDSADTLTIDVANTSATTPTNPSLTVTAVLPTGLVASSMAGANLDTGWSCNASTLTCTRSTGLAAGTSDPISLTVSVSSSAPVGAGALTVSATASGGGIQSSVTGQDAVTTQGRLVVMATDASGVYGEPLPPLTYTMTGFAGSDTQSSATTGLPSETTTATPTSIPGTYPITITQGTLASTNYTFVFVDGTFTLLKATPTTTFTGAPASAPYGSMFSVAATTNASTTAVVTASGACSIADAVVTMTAGTGTCSLTAFWAADAYYIAASRGQSTTATKAGSATSITSSSPNPSWVGQAVAVGFLVTSTAGVPTGGVTITASTGESCSAALSAGAGNCALTFNTSGSRTLTATYTGDLNFNGSSSAALAQTVNKTIAQLLGELQAMVQGVGPGKSLAAKLAVVQADLAAGDTSGACSVLAAFINEVRAQSGKTISKTTADTLIAAAVEIQSRLGCSG